MQTILPVAQSLPLRAQRALLLCFFFRVGAQKGYAATVQSTLEAGATPNAVPPEGRAATALACIHGQEAIVRLLLERGVDPTSTEGWFHAAESLFSEPEGDDDGAGRGHEHVIRLLLSYEASPDIRYSNFGVFDTTPLSIATRRGHLSIVKLLVELGCDLHTDGWWGPPILSDAAHGGHSGLVRLLLETVPDIESPYMDSFPALSAAASQGHLEIVDLLLDHWMSRTPRMDIPIAPLVRAAQGEHYTVTERLRRLMDPENFITRGEPDNDDHKQLFLMSAACGWGNLIEKLLERGCPTDFARPKNLLWVIEPKHPELTSCLGGPSPLAFAASRGQHGVVELLLSRNANVHGRKSLRKGREANPLVCAIDGTHRRIVNTLLDYGADPNYRTRSKKPVLFRAVHTPEIFQLLLDRGADPKSYARNGESVFIRALRTGSLAAVNILQRKTPFEDPPQAKGTCPTSLPEAAALGGVLMMEYLLDGAYQAVPGSDEVEKALGIILSRADTASLSSVPEETNQQLGRDQKHRLDRNGRFAKRSLGAVAATLDTLLAHGIEVDGVLTPLSMMSLTGRLEGITSLRMRFYGIEEPTLSDRVVSMAAPWELRRVMGTRSWCV